MKSPARIGVLTKAKRFQRQYDQEIEFDLGEFADISPEWVKNPLTELAQMSQLRREHRQSIVDLREGLIASTTLAGWREMTREPPSSATLEQITKYFTELEQHLAKRRGSHSCQAGRVSARTRAFIYEIVKRRSMDERVPRLRVAFVTILSTKGKGRRLLSDDPHTGREPLSAIPHESLDGLHAKFTATLESDMERLRQACIRELYEYDKTKAVVQKARSLFVSVEQESEIRTAYSDGYAKRRKLLERIGREVVLAIALRAEARLIEPLPAILDKEGSTAGSWELVRLLEPGEGYGQNISQLANVEVAPPARVLLACALLLSIHTGWNFSSVVDLDRAGINEADGDYWLQSIKTRTHDETPVVLVKQSEPGVARAISLLCDRLALLKQRGWVNHDERRLWLTFRTIYAGAPQNLINWGTARHAFIKRHGLTNFSPDQIRVQKLAQIATGPGGIGLAQIAAGHKAISTTMEYVQKLLVERRNSSILLEFERRFDATVRYLIDEKSVDAKQRLIAYPIGDGSSCSESPRDL